MAILHERGECESSITKHGLPCFILRALSLVATYTSSLQSLVLNIILRNKKDMNSNSPPSLISISYNDTKEGRNSSATTRGERGRGVITYSPQSGSHMGEERKRGKGGCVAVSIGFGSRWGLNGVDPWYRVVDLKFQVYIFSSP